MIVSLLGQDYQAPDDAADLRRRDLFQQLRDLNPDADPMDMDLLATTLTGEVGTDNDVEGERVVTAAASGSTSFPLGERDETWDAAAAEAAMSGADQLAAMHFWRDPDGDPEAKASYKLPFATPEGNSHAVWAGVTACAAAVQGARGGVQIPDADVAGVKARIEAYYTKAADQYDDDTISPPWASSTAAAVEDAPVEVSGAPAAGHWTADPLIPYGVATRDGRMIRGGSLSIPDQLPLPLMAMLEDVHGPSMTLPPSVLSGAIVAFSDSSARLAASGTLDDTPEGQRAMAAVADGRMGISADLAIEEYEFVMSQEAVDEWNQLVETGGEIDESGEEQSQDVEGGVVVESGNMTDMGMFVVTKGSVMGATIVPFAAFDESRIELTTIAADGHPTHARVVMPLRLDAQPVAAAALDPVSEGNPLPPTPEAGRAAPTPLSGDPTAAVLASLEATAATLRAQSGLAAVEALIASLRRQSGQRDPEQVDLVELVRAVGEASRDPEMAEALKALAASAQRSAPPAQPIIVNPPPVTVHTPDVKVENHQPDVHVTTADGRPRAIRIERDEHGHPTAYVPIDAPEDS